MEPCDAAVVESKLELSNWKLSESGKVYLLWCNFQQMI